MDERLRALESRARESDDALNAYGHEMARLGRSRLPVWDDHSEVWKYAEGFTSKDVAETLASGQGANDENPWWAVGRLFDGRFFYISAWCDYTGWG